VARCIVTKPAAGKNDHDCWTTTEAALTQELPEDLRDAWDRLRDTALEFGPQRVYASHACWAVHAAVGWAVTLTWKMRRRS